MASGRVRKIYRVHATSATGRGSCLVIFSKMALSLARVKVHANGRFTPAISTACQRTRTLAFVDSLAGSQRRNVSRCPLAYPIATNRCLNARARDRDGCCSVRGEVALGLEPVCDGVTAALSFVRARERAWRSPRDSAQAGLASSPAPWWSLPALGGFRRRFGGLRRRLGRRRLWLLIQSHQGRSLRLLIAARSYRRALLEINVRAGCAPGCQRGCRGRWRRVAGSVAVSRTAFRLVRGAGWRGRGRRGSVAPRRPPRRSCSSPRPVGPV